MTRTALTPGEREQLDTEGYVVLLDVFTPQECDELGDEMDTAWETYRLHEISDSEEGVRFVDNALHYSAKVQDGLLHPLILDAARLMVGPRLLLNLINGRSPAAGAAGQPLHVLDRRRGRPFDKCNAIWCLDDFTAENGATRVIPGSHLDDTAALARMGDPMDSHSDEVIVEAPRGAVIMHNSHLIHSGRPNSSGSDRRSIHAAYTHPEIPTHYDWTTLPSSVVADLSEPTFDLLGLSEAALDVGRLEARA
ncbi:phytanoyl-CoA dioxygenase family protein [Streptomyces sp. NPDC048496]|uniref:phytanoyl-CoA dioxygenase family protein n=1 Tax=Streptomyces sp. NPDC048496 TaxID=3365558 RepID=UPI003712CAB9